MSRDPHGYGIEVGDRVVVLTGTRKGDEGRVIVRNTHHAFDRFGVTFNVDFEDGANGRGYSTQFQPHHLERVTP